MAAENVGLKHKYYPQQLGIRIAGRKQCKNYHVLREGVNGQPIGATVSDAIVRSWLLSTAPGSYQLFTSLALLQVVDNLPDEQWERFSTRRLVAIADFTVLYYSEAVKW